MKTVWVSPIGHGVNGGLQRPPRRNSHHIGMEGAVTVSSVTTFPAFRLSQSKLGLNASSAKCWWPSNKPQKKKENNCTLPLWLCINRRHGQFWKQQRKKERDARSRRGAVGWFEITVLLHMSRTNKFRSRNII